MRLASLLARMLQPAEREAVLGDLAESGETGARALGSVAGLVARRQAAFWKDWRPWAALCLAIPGGWWLGWYLGRAAIGELRGLDLWIVLNHKDLDPAVLSEYGMSVCHSLVALARGAVLLPGSAWVCGVGVGWLARRAVWVHGVLFTTLMVAYPLWDARRFGDFWLSLGLCLTATIPAALGMKLGRKAAV